MKQQGYTLITYFIHGNVVGYVIAPKGKEDLPRKERAFVWRAIIKPLAEEVAEHEEFPREDALKVARDLGKFCMEQGMGFPQT
jgi:hypothetical protein